MPNIMKYGLVGLAPRRKLVGYSQTEFAEALGVERTRLANWEAGEIWPSAAFLPKMADLLCCTIDDLYRAPDPIVNEEAAEDHAG